MAMQSLTPDTSKLSSCNGDDARNARGANDATTSGKSNGSRSGLLLCTVATRGT